MGKYRILFRKSVAVDLRPIPNPDVRKILTVIESLSEEPRSPETEKLSGHYRYRIRQGNYRIVYEIDDREAIVVVVRIGHRRDVYRRI